MRCVGVGQEVGQKVGPDGVAIWLPGERFLQRVAAPTVKREFVLTPSADDTLFEAVRVLSRATRTNLSNSHFLRVLRKVVADAMPQSKQAASELGKLRTMRQNLLAASW